MKSIAIAEHAMSSLLRTYNFCQNSGVDVLAAVQSGQELCTLLQDLRPDVVLWDLELSDATFEEAVRVCEGVRFSPFFVVISCYSSPQMIRRCMERGAHYFIQKPLDVEEFEEIKKRVSLPTREK